MTPLSCQRALFALPETDTWLNSAYMGPLPRPVLEAGHAALDLKAFPARISPADFFEPAERTRARCSALVGADPERVAFITNVAAGAAIVARNLAPRPGSNVVVLDRLFPSSLFAWRGWRREGVEVRTVAPPAADAADPRAWRARCEAWSRAVIEAIDGDTLLAAVEQAHWTDGTLFDLDAIAARCRATGAAFVVDATQTAGAMPIDAATLRPDLLVVHAYKSMLSNYGLGFAVLGERLADGRPHEESWLVRRGAEDFTRLVDYQDDYAVGMRRYDTSLRANPVLIRMLETASGLLLDWGPARIRDYLLGISRDAVARLRAAGFGVADEDLRAANVFGVHLPAGLDAERCRAELAQRRVHVSVRGDAVRVSPHVYNDAQDLARLADALIEVAGR